MRRSPSGCQHADAVSHGDEPGDPTRDPNTPNEHEVGWCRRCANYVQREHGAAAWALRPVCESGAWIWRPDDVTAPRIAAAVRS